MLKQEERELLHKLIGYANDLGRIDYDMGVLLTEEGDDWVGLAMINEEGEKETTATLTILGDFEYTDTDFRHPIKPKVATLIGVWIDGSRERWRIIDARADSLFAILYC